MRNYFLAFLLLWSFSAFANSYFAQANDTIPTNIYGGLKMRNLTPAFVSGRIADFAVNPNNHSEYYIGVAAGNIWKTTNNGTTFKPVFENYGAYAIGCLKMDPNNSKTVWAGTGENNHQRAIGYGNGIYKTTNGGKSWKNMGLKESRQIGMIAIHPDNSDMVFVAAEGSIWGSGGERGLYKTIDGGESWKKVLEISEHTGVNNVIIDPNNPNIIYATSEQRRRHVNIRIGGGPESAIYKSTDGGETFQKIMKGLPKVDIGGIGIAVNDKYIYAIVEAALKKGGFYRSDNQGKSWKKMSSYSASGQYYNEIFCDPKDDEKVYSVETRSRFSEDGGKTWKKMGSKNRHVDDHALWIDPTNTNHFMIGGDGGIYETFDAGQHFVHKSNLPVTQFYRVNVDNSYPFYWVYGGTQDNSSLGAPSQSLYSDGVTRGDWVVTQGGDGFWQAIDPTDPNVVYSEYQYGNIFRFDKKSGESLSIKPRERQGEDLYKWNWNSPFILSPHSHTRLYMTANKVFRSDDRGNSWKVISDDITAKIPRDNAPVMGRYWGVDAVAKNVSTSLYGMGVSLEESPLQEDLVYVGTDDGLIQVTDDAKTWHKIERFPGVPAHTYVSDIRCSKHQKETVFASFDNRKRDDFKPYILMSTNKGRTWKSISGDLPKNGTVHTIEQDHVNPNLLFVGTEFGVFFTVDQGKKWVQLKSGMPTISVKDIVIQQRESDLVMATFGRGFYILDDYSPLREINEQFQQKEFHLFPVKDALKYIQKRRGGYGFGSTVYKTKNAPFGTTFTYFIKEVPKTLTAIRHKKEKELIKNNQPIPLATIAELEKEKNEVEPYLVFSISDASGKEIKKINTKFGKGIQRLSWNLTIPYKSPIMAPKNQFNPLRKNQDWVMVPTGEYKVTIYKVVRNETTKIVDATPFKILPFDNQTFKNKLPKDLFAFQKKVNLLGKKLHGTQRFANELKNRIVNIKQAIVETPNCPPSLLQTTIALEQQIKDVQFVIYGETPKASYEEVTPAVPPLNTRFSSLRWIHHSSSAPVTQTEIDLYQIIEGELPPLIQTLTEIHDNKLPELEALLDKYDVGWTPGRLPK